MSATEAQKKASIKWDQNNTKRYSIKARKELANQIDSFLNSDEGKQYKSANNLFLTAVKKLLKEHGIETE